ncbi:hypothetical protein GOODEAATRI_008209 [Goodea atripinnis]|uniref:Uncharacterized protein n=1 Tax=Goodea atripinnis TaxID=208336 RepID=A0ABV0MQ94_9TELE
MEHGSDQDTSTELKAFAVQVGIRDRGLHGTGQGDPSHVLGEPGAISVEHMDFARQHQRLVQEDQKLRMRVGIQCSGNGFPRHKSCRGRGERHSDMMGGEAGGGHFSTPLL